VEGGITHIRQPHGTMLETKEMFLLQQTAYDLSTSEKTLSPSEASLKNQKSGLNHSDRHPTHSQRIRQFHDHEQSFPSLQLATPWMN
jgi:hypothetical protein